MRTLFCLAVTLTTYTWKILNIWQRIDGRWTFIGGMAMQKGDRVW